MTSAPEQIEETKTYRLSPRRMYPSYLLLGIYIIISAVILIAFPNNGVKLFEIQKFSFIISKLAVFLVLFAILLIVSISVLVKLLVTRSYVITVSPTSITFSYGIITKKMESVEMHAVKDIVYKQQIWDTILKTADVHIYSDDFTTPHVWFDSMEIEVAKSISDYIEKYSSESIVKYYAQKKM